MSKYLDITIKARIDPDQYNEFKNNGMNDNGICMMVKKFFPLKDMLLPIDDAEVSNVELKEEK